MSTAQRIQLPDGSTVNLPGGGSWNLIKTVTTEEEVSYISENLGGQYSSVLLIFKNVWSESGGKSTSISFNGNTPWSNTNSVSGRWYINTSTYPSSGFYEAEMLKNGYAKIITGGVNSGGNRGNFTSEASEANVLPPSYLNGKEYFDEVSFSLSGYATHKLNAGAKITIYAK